MDQAPWPGGSSIPARAEWGGQTPAGPSESSCLILRPAWTRSSFSRGLLPRAGRPGIILLAKGLKGVGGFGSY